MSAVVGVLNRSWKLTVYIQKVKNNTSCLDSKSREERTNTVTIILTSGSKGKTLTSLYIQHLFIFWITVKTIFHKHVVTVSVIKENAKNDLYNETHLPFFGAIKQYYVFLPTSVKHRVESDSKSTFHLSWRFPTHVFVFIWRYG